MPPNVSARRMDTVMKQTAYVYFASLVLATTCGGGGKGATEPPPPPPPTGPIVDVWVSTASGAKKLTQETDIRFGTGAGGTGTVIDVDDAQQFQEIIGFGAAITDASAYLIQTKLSASARDALMQDLFGRNPGIGLSFTRLTIGASDFSQTHYSLDDMPVGQTDPTLAQFSIDPNRAAVLPTVKQALSINPQLKVMASPWSAPGWMKTTNSLIQGTLRPEAFGPFAEYFKRYIQAYATEGVPIYAITVQNEPHFEPANYPGMSLDTAQRAKFVGENLGPLFANSGIQTKIWDLDHNWDLYWSPMNVLSHSTASQYIDGVAWHCYGGDVSAQITVHNAFPAKDAVFTECSGGEWATNWSENLKWFVGTLIIQSTRNWSKGALYWNLALDENHGPHLGGCGDCRGVVTISAGGVITRNVEYYSLAHASKFVRAGAHRIASTSGIDGISSVAFKNADDGSKVLILLNTAANERTVVVRWSGQFVNYVLPAGAAVTLHWS